MEPSTSSHRAPGRVFLCSTSMTPTWLPPSPGRSCSLPQAPTACAAQPTTLSSSLWSILSSAANSQQNPEQAVSRTSLFKAILQNICVICKHHVFLQQHQGGPKVEKVFFTTAIPVGGNAGKSSVECHSMHNSAQNWDIAYQHDRNQWVCLFIYANGHVLFYFRVFSFFLV